MLKYYNMMLNEKLEFLLILLIILVFEYLYFKNKFMLIGSICLNFGVHFAVAFYLHALIKCDNYTDFYRILNVLFFEVIVLLCYIKILKKVFISFFKTKYDFSKVLFYLLLIRFLIVIILIQSGSYGIFSAFERIDFIGQNWYFKYLNYLSSFLGICQLYITTIIILQKRRKPFTFYLTLIQVILISVLSGSKGEWVLWFMGLFGLTSIVNLKSIRTYLVASILIITFIYSSNILIKNLGITNTQYYELVFNRLFLNNDARALALDLSSNQSRSQSFAKNTWRSIGNFVGEPSRDLPIGNVLYNKAFNQSKTTGANASLTALLLFYCNDYQIFFCSLLFVIILLLFNGLIPILYKSYDYIIYSILIFGIPLLSQDYLAFQIFFRIIIFHFIILFFINLITSFRYNAINNSFAH